MHDIISLNQNWRFHLGDIVSVRNRWAWSKSGSWNQGPESRNFDDSNWKQVQVPHDFVFETEVYAYSEKEFDEDNAIPAMEDVNNIHTTAGSFQKDIGWYRKHFYLPKSYEGKKLYLIFDGIYRDSSIFLNEFYVGGERSGYSQIMIDITDTAAYGADNLLVVRCNALEAEGWFYEGGGIYRDVRLKVVEPDYIEDVYVHATPNLDTMEAALTMQIALCMDAQKKLALQLVLSDASKRELGHWNYEVTQEKETIQQSLSHVQLWSLEHPYLYHLTLSLVQVGKIVDETELRFGIREISFDSEKGFFINGKHEKIKGVCCHQNHGGLGIAVPDEVFRYRIKALKKMGANAYRCSHYPVSESLLSICDEEGMMVMCENRLLSSEEGSLSQLRRMVKLSRNHPCVILYSIGNEEAQSQATPQGARIAKSMIAEIKKLDADTPVTMALLMFDLKNKKPYLSTDILAGISEQLDVAGFNYHDEMWQSFHQRYPSQPFICTEQGTFKSTRGCYETNAEQCHLAITDHTSNSYMTGAWQWQNCLPDWVSGLFIWTGFDYYGEPTPYAWPAISSQFGAMDLCGYPKDFYYFYQAWWSQEPVLHVFPDMNVTPGTHVDYHVFSNAQEVELILNGKSLGKKTMPENGFLVWSDITAEAGEMTVLGYRHDNCQKKILYTAGQETTLQVTETYREQDIVIYQVAIVDEYGHVVPNADQEFTIPVEWGTLLGASNGNPSDHTPGKCRTRKTFHGLAQVIVREDTSRRLLHELQSPSEEFSPIPFWFFNDGPNEEKIKAQLTDYVEKGVNGIVLHPRIGIPETVPYLSESYFAAVRFLVKTAAQLNMKIVLYDEGMYPSGSAHGQVVAVNPDYASKGIYIVEQEQAISKTGKVITTFADGTYLVYDFTGGTIRGIHFGEDDGEADAPASADILNPEAVDTFIQLTHDKYYEALKEYFGSTIIAFFTDEPCALGRNAGRFREWVPGLEQELLSLGGNLEDLQALFAGKTNATTNLYHTLIKKHLRTTFYGKLSSWCEQHGISLMGHPEASDDIEEELYFHIPGQDLIMRRVSPEQGGVHGFDSVQAKLSADIARHLGRRRNANECFGVCFRDKIPWYFTGADMKWYLDWLGIRGVNLYVPHAFYYSIAGKRKEERPPDVGPHNIWWKHYRRFSDYMKRLSYLMTDSVNSARVAVLCDNNRVPYEELATLYERQIEFNYLPIALLPKCYVEDNRLCIRDNQYDIILNVTDEAWNPLLPSDWKKGTQKSVSDEFRTVQTKQLCPDLRVTKLWKYHTVMYLFSNEGESDIDTVVEIAEAGIPIYVDLWTGEYARLDSSSAISLQLSQRETKLLLFSKEQETIPYQQSPQDLGDWTDKFIQIDEKENQLVYEYTYKTTLVTGQERFYVTGEEMAECYCNGKFVDVSFWNRHTFQIGDFLQTGENVITLVLTGTAANLYCDANIPYGLL